MINKLKSKLMSMVGKCVITAINDTDELQALQIESMSNEIADDIIRVQDYGFSSVPEVDMEAITLSINGDRTDSVVIAVADSQYRLKGLENGDVTIYNNKGYFVKLGQSQIVVSGDEVLLGSENITPTAPAVSCGVITGESIDPFTGQPHIDASTKIKAEK